MKLLDQLRDAIRKKHYSIRTEEAYVNWIKRYIFFHGKRHPEDIGEQEIAKFISYMATDSKVASRKIQGSDLESCCMTLLYFIVPFGELEKNPRL